MSDETRPITRIVRKRADLDRIADTQSDYETEYVHTPEWALEGEDPAHVYVLVRGLTGTERDNYESGLFRQRGNNREMNLSNARAKLAQATMIDPDTRQPIYAANEITLLGKRSAKALDRVFDAAQRLSGLRKQDIEELTDELKNDQSG